MQAGQARLSVGNRSAGCSWRSTLTSHAAWPGSKAARAPVVN